MWQSLAPGTYLVSFGDFPGYATPPNQTVAVVAGQETYVVGDYVPQGEAATPLKPEAQAPAERTVERSASVVDGPRVDRLDSATRRTWVAESAPPPPPPPPRPAAAGPRVDRLDSATRRTWVAESARLHPASIGTPAIAVLSSTVPASAAAAALAPRLLALVPRYVARGAPAAPPPPTVCLRPRPPPPPRPSPAWPRSCRTISRAWATPVAPTGWPRAFNPPEVFTEIFPFKAVRPSAVAGPPLPFSTKRRSSIARISLIVKLS